MSDATYPSGGTPPSISTPSTATSPAPPSAHPSGSLALTGSPLMIVLVCVALFCIMAAGMAKLTERLSDWWFGE